MMRTLAAAIKADVPVLLWGPPGVGKTAKLTAAGARSGYHVETVVGSTREPTDFLGLPVEHEGAIVYSPFKWAHRVNEAPKAILFLDELTTAAPSVQKAMLRLVQERYAGDLRLGDTVRIVAAANPPELAADGWDLPAPVANRMMHLDWHFDHSEWFANVGTRFGNVEATGFDQMVVAGGLSDRARATSMVTGFLRSRPALLAPEPPNDPVLAGRAWASPRSWANLIDVLAQVPSTDDEVALLASEGLVGEGVSKEFMAWLSENDLYDPAEVLRNPDIVVWGQARPDQLYALMSGIETLAISLGTPRSWEAGMEVLTRAAENNRPDIALAAVRNLLSPSNRPAGTTLGDRTRAAFTGLMSRTRNGYAA